MTLSLSNLVCWSLSASSGDAAQTREDFALPQERLKETLELLIAGSRVNDVDCGIFYLATCHRIELYAFGLDPDDLARRWAEIKGCELPSNERMHKGVNVQRHLVRVIAGLESEVLGETQVGGQVKEASTLMRDWGLLRGTLDRCVQQALRSSKTIRTESRLGEGTVSVAHVAIDGLSDVFDSLVDKKVLVVGAGAMALQSLDRLAAKGVTEITWMNRTREKMLAQPFASKARLLGLDQLANQMWGHDVIVLAVRVSEPMVNRIALKIAREFVRKSGQRKCDGPRVILDLGLPRNAHESIHGLDGFYLRNVDEFRDRAESGLSLRRQRAQDAERLLDVELTEFQSIWKNWQLAPLLARLTFEMDEIRKQMLVELNVEEDSEMGYTLHAFYKKLLHRLIQEASQSANQTLGQSEASNQLLETLINSWRHPAQWLQNLPQSPNQKSPELPPENPAKVHLLRP